MKSRAERRRRFALGWSMLALAVAACGGGRYRTVSDVPVKIGRPYQAGGRWWTPADDPVLDEVGHASWYGAGHQGAATASGERFDRHRISAAHRTLPLPSYAEVTALDSGRTILVRINDRGPFRPERVIDLSQAAARQLGIEGQGVARVRVRRVQPHESDRALLRAGRSAGDRQTVPAAERAALLRRLGAAPVPIVRSAPPAGAVFVQIASLSDRDRAQALAGGMGDLGTADVAAAGSLWRVRLGPYPDVASATAALARVRARGYQDAHLAGSALPE